MQKDTPYDVHAGYFQIQDQLALDYRPANAPTDGQASQPEQSPLFGLLGELHLLDHESQHLLRQVGERDRNLAAYLKILGKRVELIGRALALQMTDDMGAPVAVTLSEAGLGFSACDALEVGSWISLRLLLPTPVGLSAPARVVDCALDNASGRYLIQVSFEQLNDAQRQLLARHIVQKQAQEIRAAKNNERTST
ncbi:PilZ domain-containing protein [Halopseudomonas litoralis]|uniref:PilZ domain-containing protein n=1 Tax=Halopseudomonas litoralis TaxID=797277 RepID=A0A1H1RS99_9GAMM|nr:PilZ domain-containing protein [Halopseudomonas litoralis]SDS38416.1 PilZ domain-containing protein [Halopseudomonas litoralis]